jgi:hypothetical protein
VSDLKSLAASIAATPPDSSGMLMGNVVSVDTDASLTINVRGGVVSGIRYLSHVAPRPGYPIVLQRVGNDLLAVGTLAQQGHPCCRIRRNADGAAFASGFQTVSFDVAEHDPWGMWTSGTNVVIPIPGAYSMSGHLEFDADATGSARNAYILVNGSVHAYQRNGPTTQLISVATAVVSCAAGDIVTLAGAHNSTTNRFLIGGNQYRSVLTVNYEGARP